MWHYDGIRFSARVAFQVQSSGNPVTFTLAPMSSRIPPELTDRIIDFLWESQADLRACSLVCRSFPPSLRNFPVLPQVTELSFQHTKFPSCSNFAWFLSTFPALRELELKWITWADAGDDVWPHLALELESLSVQGFQQNPDILPWLSCCNHAPRTRALCLYLPNNADSIALGALAKFIHHLDGHLQDLQLDVYPSPYLQRILSLLELDDLTSLRRLRIAHGVYFYPPEGTCRVFPIVPEIALRVMSRNRLDELIFDVDIATHSMGSNSDSFFKKFLADPALQRIPTVRFHVLRSRQNCGAVDIQCRQFSTFMRERGVIDRNVVYC
ncbi:hypothetical protein B0H19DRAFT_1228018 [Mycena capillaripes]|nr:hypothetical protein B0H19DRAFT_1228018 [Mycena capillaripes]